MIVATACRHAATPRHRQWIENTSCALFRGSARRVAAILTAVGLRTALAFVFVFTFTGERVDVRVKEPRS